MKEVIRHVDSGEHLNHFEDEVLVVCPKCAACAKQIRTDEFDPATNLKVRKLICATCGLAKRGGTLILPDVNHHIPHDLTLWLQTPSCSHTLWAFNLHHIETIESYVRAGLREQHFVTNTTFVNRLPKWIKYAKNRDEILKGIGRLKEKLPA